MALIFIAYFAISLTALGILTSMILRIGAMIGECPQSGAAARSGAVTIATGFAAIGLGGVVLAAIIMPMLGTPLVGLLLAVGLASLALGLGFTQAVATLRAVVAESLAPAVTEAAEPA